MHDQMTFFRLVDCYPTVPRGLFVWTTLKGGRLDNNFQPRKNMGNLGLVMNRGFTYTGKIDAFKTVGFIYSYLLSIIVYYPFSLF